MRVTLVVLALALGVLGVRGAAPAPGEWQKVLDHSSWKGDVFSIAQGITRTELWVCGTQEGLLTRFFGDPPVLSSATFPLKLTGRLCRIVVKSLDASKLYVGGAFEGTFRVFDLRRGVEVPVASDSLGMHINAIVPTDTGAYVAGSFETPFFRVATYDAASSSFHALGTRMPNNVAEVIALTQSGAYLYAGLQVHGTDTFRRLNLLSGADAAWEVVPGPKVDNTVLALLPSVDDQMFVGGAFSSPAAHMFLYNTAQARVTSTFAFPSKVEAFASSSQGVIAGGPNFLSIRGADNQWQALAGKFLGHILTIFATVDDWIYVGGRNIGLQRIKLYAPPTAAPTPRYIDMPAVIERRSSLLGNVIAAADCRCYADMMIDGQLQLLQSSSLFVGPDCSLAIKGPVSLAGNLIVLLSTPLTRAEPKFVTIVMASTVTGAFDNIEVELPNALAPCERVVKDYVQKPSLFGVRITLDHSQCSSGVSTLPTLLIVLVVLFMLVVAYVAFRRRGRDDMLLPMRSPSKKRLF